MELVEFGVLTDELRAELEGDETDPWDAARVPPMQWRSKERHVGLREDGGPLIANAGLIVVEVEVGGARFPVVGVGGVIVNREHRGRGLSLRVVEAAVAKAATLGPDFAVLFCHEDRTGLYRRFGFEGVGGEVLVDDDGGQIVMAMQTMWRALSSGARWPEGRVVVHSLPF
jgi:predicted N-acetyltransferase YhbS